MPPSVVYSRIFKIINITGDIINNKLNNKKNSNLLFQNIVAPILSELTSLLIDLIIIKITEITIRIEKYRKVQYPNRNIMPR